MTALILLLLAQSPKVELPAELQARPGRLIQITAKSENKVVKWFLANGDADLIVMESTRTAIFSAMESGQYRIVAYTAAGDVPSDPSICVVTVGDGKPGPILPTPESDPFAKSLASIWGGLQEPNRIANKSALTEVFRQAIALADDKRFLDLGAWNAAVKRLRAEKVGDDKLVAIRERIAEELGALGDDAQTAFGPELRAKAKSICGRIVAALEALK
ncbi:MAG: hypothetical protein EBR82_35955 [Caulobacteraceae bacterium]|nr:hypothetical protein [Caulobacteraceae bacterium]